MAYSSGGVSVSGVSGVSVSPPSCAVRVPEAHLSGRFWFPLSFLSCFSGSSWGRTEAGTTGWSVGHGERAAGSARGRLLGCETGAVLGVGVAGWLLREVCGRCALWGGCSVRAGGSGACRSLSILSALRGLRSVWVVRAGDEC